MIWLDFKVGTGNPWYSYNEVIEIITFFRGLNYVPIEGKPIGIFI